MPTRPGNRATPDNPAFRRMRALDDFVYQHGHTRCTPIASDHSAPTAHKNAKRTESIARLRDEYLKAGATVYGILRPSGRLGKTRHLALFCIRDDRLAYLTWDISIALGIRYNRDREALCVDGRASEADERVIRALAQELFGSDDALKYYLA